jgi:hypothetical protein
MDQHDIKMVAVHLQQIEELLPLLRDAMHDKSMDAFSQLGKVKAHVQMLGEWLPPKAIRDAQKFIAGLDK